MLRPAALFLGLSLFAVAARAQILNAETEFLHSSNGLSIALLHPIDADGRLDCIIGQPSCQPLNAAACGEDPLRNIEVELAVQSPVALGSDLIVWLQEGDRECVHDFGDDSTEATRLDTVSLDLDSDPLVSSVHFQFPAHGRELTSYTTDDVLKNSLLTLDACAEDGRVDLKWYKLCFGLDLWLNASPDNNIETTEPSAWVRLLVDTKPPSTPAMPNVESLDGRLRVTLDSNDTDVYEWRIVTVEREADAEPPTPSCDGWRDAHPTKINGDVRDLDDEVLLVNGVTYDVWVCAVDVLGNVSAPSPMTSGTPMDQCDFIECYPGKLRGGYCSAAGGSASLAWLLLLGLAARRRGRRS